MSEKMDPNSNPRKPEWFELTDSSAPSAQVRKINKVLPSLALLISATVIGAGALFANVSGNAPTSLAASVSTGTSTSTSTGEIIGTSTTNGSAEAASAIANPAAIGVAPPRGGGDDDDYEDDD